MDTTLVPAVVLAAGHSRRLGRPKALVMVNGKTLVEWAYDRLRNAGCTPVVVVNASIETDVRQRLPEASIVVNPDPDAGRTGSLQLGLQPLLEAFEGPLRRLVMVPVDRPCWNVNLLQALLGHHGNAAPMASGRKGHPVVLDAEAVVAVRHAEEDQPLRDIVSFTGVTFDAPWLHMNIDTQDDVDQLVATGPHLSACFSQSEGI